MQAVRQACACKELAQVDTEIALLRTSLTAVHEAKHAAEEAAAAAVRRAESATADGAAHQQVRLQRCTSIRVWLSPLFALTFCCSDSPWYSSLLALA